jgi:hypothetical protein
LTMDMRGPGIPGPRVLTECSDPRLRLPWPLLD